MITNAQILALEIGREYYIETNRSPSAKATITYIDNEDESPREWGIGFAGYWCIANQIADIRTPEEIEA